jgi:1-aminocyclopropane-1-carboxylate deaminase
MTEPPLTAIHDPLLTAAGISCFIKREDLLANRPGSPLCGNKWRKLYYNLEAAKKYDKTTLLTFGGAYSNHLAAVAEAAHWMGMTSIGIVRGEEISPLNPTLRMARDAGMKLVFTNREKYRSLTRGESVADFISFNPDTTYTLPEGGTNSLALKGCAHIMNGINTDFVAVACGTGGTLAGMITALPQGCTALGFSVLKGNFLQDSVRDLLPDNHRGNWQMIHDYHFGGYGKWKPELLQFIRDFRSRHQIALDPIYTGKMCYGVFDMVRNGAFPRGSSITLIHTGGLQGIPGFEERFNLRL